MSEARRSGGVGWLLAATAVGGAGGYAIQLTAPSLLDDASTYVAFGTFWSAMYLGVSLLSGIQNEVTRSIRPRTGDDPAGGLGGLRWLAVPLVLLLAACALAGAVGVRPGLVVGGAWLVAAAAGYVVVAIVGGVLQGLERWRGAAVLTATDTGVRVVLVVAAMAAGASGALLYAAISVPFAIASVLVLIFLGRSLSTAYRVDVDTRTLARQIGSSVAASASLGFLVSGLPSVMSALARSTPHDELAALLLVVGIARAPMIIPVLALQGFFVVRFRDEVDRLGRLLLRGSAALLGATLLAAGAAAVLGATAVDRLSGGRYEADGWFVAAMVAGAGLLACQAWVGCALLGQGRHREYVTVWVGSAVTTVLLLAGPGPLDVRTTVATIVGPVVGLLVAARSVRAVGERSATDG